MFFWDGLRESPRPIEKSALPGLLPDSLVVLVESGTPTDSTSRSVELRRDRPCVCECASLMRPVLRGAVRSVALLIDTAGGGQHGKV